MNRIECQPLNILHADKPTSATVKLIRAVVGLPVNILKVAYVWQKRADQRRQLSEMNTRLLRDMGLSEDAARQEYSKPFWLP